MRLKYSARDMVFPNAAIEALCHKFSFRSALSFSTIVFEGAPVVTKQVLYAYFHWDVTRVGGRGLLQLVRAKASNQ